MKKLIQATVLVFLALNSAATCMAASGVTLQQACKEFIAGEEGRKGDEMQSGVCMGYVASSIDSIRNMKATPEFKNDILDATCMPENVDVRQVILVVNKFLKDSPEFLHYNAHSIIINAVARTFPCN